MNSTVNPAFWYGKKVFLTGHTGFKGSWLSLWLQSMGSVVKGYALSPPTQPALFNIAKVGASMESQIGDIRDLATISASMKAFNADILIHMAAQPLVRLSYREPVETYATNVMGTVHVLEAARNTNSVRAIVNVTSDKCYDNKEWLWGYRENDAIGGHDPYSNSKGCVELVSSAYRKSFFNSKSIAMATARAGNVIGGGDWATNRLVPDILLALEHNLPVQIRSPNSIRPWQNVLEPLRGYLMLAERLYTHGQDFAEAWNFGPNHDDAKTVQWIVEHMCAVWGNGASWSKQAGTHPHEAGFLRLEISKAQQCLNWVPLTMLQTTLVDIIDWHKSWLAGADMRQACLKRIEFYQNIPCKP